MSKVVGEGKRSRAGLKSRGSEKPPKNKII